jgi:hypothetical protein
LANNRGKTNGRFHIVDTVALRIYHMADIDKAVFYKTYVEGTFFSELARDWFFFPLSVWDADCDQALFFFRNDERMVRWIFFSFPFGTQISPRGLFFAFFSLPSPQNQKKNV